MVDWCTLRSRHWTAAGTAAAADAYEMVAVPPDMSAVPGGHKRGRPTGSVEDARDKHAAEAPAAEVGATRMIEKGGVEAEEGDSMMWWRDAKGGWKRADRPSPRRGDIRTMTAETSMAVQRMETGVAVLGDSNNHKSTAAGRSHMNHTMFASRVVAGDERGKLAG